MNWKKNMKPIDFSIKHNIMIANDEDPSIVHPMDEPYFDSQQITDHVWKVYSCGDYSYVVEGEEESIVIDSGYGCGDIREFCQSFTGKPIYRIANTHPHFDHTANNYLFDAAYMSKLTYEHRTMPFPSFAGLDFPRDYPVVIIDEGYVIDLGGGTTLETFAFSNHNDGSLGWLCRKERLFFIGDEFVPKHYGVRHSVAHSVAMYKKLIDEMDAYDACYGGSGLVTKDDIVKGYNAMLKVLENNESDWEPFVPVYPEEEPLPALTDNVTIERRAPRPWDKPRFRPNPEDVFKRNLTHDGFTVSFDIRHIYE